ncbi:MAG: AAA family ATPase [Chloroflexota bacterium]|nr:AAA family ATPase [Chloroflexota bacterium]
MTYYQRFGLAREPFGTTPDPEMFYKTLGHEDCYERLKLAIHLQRGLSVIIGDIGYGKTTIKVALLQELQAAPAGGDPPFEIGIVNNPRDCRTDVQFLRSILGQFGVAPQGRTGLDLTTDFLRYLEAMHLARRRVLLVIDEGQNLAGSQLEILRTFLSFETPTQKLINIVIFAQPELEEKIVRKRNLAQRVGMDHKLNPLNRRDTAGMIAHRLAIAGRPAGAPPLFVPEAIDVIHERSGGVPRAITNFCADCLVEAAFLGRDNVDGALAADVIGRRVFTGTPGLAGRHGSDLDPGDGPIIQSRIPIGGETLRATVGTGATVREASHA